MFGGVVELKTKVPLEAMVQAVDTMPRMVVIDAFTHVSPLLGGGG